MSRMLRSRWLIFCVAGALVCSQASAQVSSKSGTPKNPTVTTAWGYYIWQVDQGPAITRISTEEGFNYAPGTVDIPISLPGPMTIHEIHGSVNVDLWGVSSCPNESFIVEIKDQNGNAIFSVNAASVLTTTNSTLATSVDIPIKGKFHSGLALSSLTLQTFTTQCNHGVLTILSEIVMS
jgi:hypothetical protein